MLDASIDKKRGDASAGKCKSVPSDGCFWAQNNNPRRLDSELLLRKSNLRAFVRAFVCPFVERLLRQFAFVRVFVWAFVERLLGNSRLLGG